MNFIEGNWLIAIKNKSSLNFEKYQTAINMAFLDKSVDEYLWKKIVSWFITFTLASYSIHFLNDQITLLPSCNKINCSYYSHNFFKQTGFLRCSCSLHLEIVYKIGCKCIQMHFSAKGIRVSFNKYHYSNWANQNLGRAHRYKTFYGRKIYECS
jgi:hypothetical protein